MANHFSIFQASQRICALTLLTFLAACGGGDDSTSGTVSNSPKPNPVTTAPTTECSAAGVAASNASTATVTVCMLTSSGEMVIALDPAKAPVTVANYLQYVSSGYYNNTIFHRVEPGFVIQGGGYTTGRVAKSGQAAAIVLETPNGLSNVRGTIAMARTSVANSATSEFYFNSVDNLNLDYASASSPGYAVFGRVINGSAVLDSINAGPVLTMNGFNTPATEVLLYWVKRLK